MFPGGAVAPEDHDPEWETHSARTGEEAARSLDVDDHRRALASFVCALRESFEEVGFLLASGDIDGLSRHDADDAARFLEVAKTRGLQLRTDLLTPAGRWVTPLGAPVRFDTRFFLVEAPVGWEPVPDPREVDRCWWIAPSRALAELGSGDLMMAPPTIEMLQRLDGHDSVEQITRSLVSTPVGHAGDLISVRLSPLVHVVLAPNPGIMTGPGTNTFVVGAGPTVVIDPAVEDVEYLEAVAAAAGDVASILITHRHSDHIGGVASLARRVNCSVRAFGTEPIDGVEVEPLADGDRIEVGSVNLEVLHTPGHAPDHLCFYLREGASLFAGDNILGEGTAVIAPPEGNMRDYLASLRRLRELHIDRIYPGHFRPLHGGAAVIDGYLQHRAERRASVLTALEEGASSEQELVARIYSDTPKHLHPVARLQVRSMLELLRDEGRVSVSEDRWALTDVD